MEGLNILVNISLRDASKSSIRAGDIVLPFKEFEIEGYKMLFPVFILISLKLIIPQVKGVSKEELFL